MPIKDYIKPPDTTDVASRILEAQEQGLSSRTILMALGDFWHDYYDDLDALITVSNGAVILVSEAYKSLLDSVLSSTLLHIPVEAPISNTLIVFSEDDVETVLQEDGSVDYYKFDSPDLANIEYLVSSIFEPEVVLKGGGDHYSVTNGELRFYVDVFNDPDIYNNSYNLDTPHGKKLLLWATNLALVETNIYDRFGVYLYDKAVDSEDYRWLTTSLLYFYANTKSTKRIETIVNILFGLPFSRTPGEVVESISYVDDEYNEVANVGLCSLIKITTDWNTYYTYPYSELLVTEGQTLTEYELIARFHYVNDYITDPDWFEGARFPYELLEEYRDPDFLAYTKTDPSLATYTEYLQETFGSDLAYDSSRRHVGSIPISESWPGKNPLYDVRTSSTGESYEVKLYDLMDNVLKYNILYVYTQITWESYDFWKNNTRNTTEIVQSGLPTYLYPLVDTIFRAVFYDSFEITEQYSSLSTIAFTPDVVKPCPLKLFDGTRSYGEEIYRGYDGTYLHNGSIECDQKVHLRYDGTLVHDGEDFHNQYSSNLTHECEDNPYNVRGKTLASDEFAFTEPETDKVGYTGDYGHNGAYTLEEFVKPQHPQEVSGVVINQDQVESSDVEEMMPTLSHTDSGPECFGRIFDGSIHYHMYDVNNHTGVRTFSDEDLFYGDAPNYKTFASEGINYSGETTHETYTGRYINHISEYLGDNEQLDSSVNLSDNYKAPTAELGIVGYDGSHGHTGAYTLEEFEKPLHPQEVSGVVINQDQVPIPTSNNIHRSSLACVDALCHTVGHTFDGSVSYNIYDVTNHTGNKTFEEESILYNETSKYITFSSSNIGYEGNTTHEAYPGKYLPNMNPSLTDTLSIIAIRKDGTQIYL